MVKKTKTLWRRISNSDRNVQRLYQEAISELRDRNVSIPDAPIKAESVKTRNQAQQLPTQSAGKRRDKLLYKSRRHEQRGSPCRGSLRIPVSKLLPFRYDPRGYHFPADFRKDDTSNAWVPRTTADESFGSTSAETTADSECGTERYSAAARPNVCENDDRNVFDMDELLQVLPLRPGDDEDTGSLSSCERSSTAAADISLPPLYKRDVWREIIARASPSGHSIPAKTGASDTGKSISLMIGNEESYSKERRNKMRRISLVERRARLRAAGACSSKAFKALGQIDC